MAETVRQILKELHRLADPARAVHSQGFFKTGKGEYGEGDKFMGIRVPRLRSLARKYKSATREEILALLKSEFHEARLTALFMLVALYRQADTTLKEQIFNDYLSHMKYINNWDLVDTSAPHIIGPHLFSGDRAILYRLARSQDLWERRVSILATQYFIRRQDFSDTIALSKLLLKDNEDLIHKAVGWMLREVGNRSRAVEEDFLKDVYSEMPRTMLRYAIEKFPEDLRQAYLKGNV